MATYQFSVVTDTCLPRRESLDYDKGLAKSKSKMAVEYIWTIINLFELHLSIKIYAKAMLTNKS